MAYWDIDPPGVRGVLGKTAGIARGFEGDLAGLGQASQDAAAQTDSPLVNQALTDYTQSQQQDTSALFDRAAAGLRGAAEATRAYTDGDREMVLNAQRHAAAAPDPTGTMPGSARQ